MFVENCAGYIMSSPKGVILLDEELNSVIIFILGYSSLELQFALNEFIDLSLAWNKISIFRTTFLWFLKVFFHISIIFIQFNFMCKR